MNLNYPFGYDGRGQTAACEEDDHIRQMIEQVIFTSQSERVNRPSFGSGILKLVFAPNSDALAAATSLTVQGALQHWLGDLIQIESVEVQSTDGSLNVLVQYTIRRTQERKTIQFSRGEMK
jgi:uncharacterized protein